MDVFFQPPYEANLRKAKCQQIFDKQVFRRDHENRVVAGKAETLKIDGSISMSSKIRLDLNVTRSYSIVVFFASSRGNVVFVRMKVRALCDLLNKHV